MVANWMTNNAFEHAKRKRRTPLQLTKIFVRDKGECYVCHKKLTARDQYEFEHVLALELGGEDTDENLSPCCKACHKPKTAADHKAGSKGKRVTMQNVLPQKFKTKGRPMPGSRNSEWKRKMSGEVIRRK